MIRRIDVADGNAAEALATWETAKDFAGPQPVLPEPLKPWEKYAQVLLLANEFLYVD